jgi:hypothetical protein
MPRSSDSAVFNYITGKSIGVKIFCYFSMAYSAYIAFMCELESYSQIQQINKVMFEDLPFTFTCRVL